MITDATRPRSNPAAAFFDGRTWREYGYLALSVPLAAAALAYVIAVPSVTAGVLVTVVGLVVPGAMILGARGWGAMYRSLAHSLLDEPVADPPAFVRPRGFWRSLAAAWSDGTGWRALLFMFVSFPLSLFTFIVSTTILGVGAGLTTWGIWFRFLPLQTMADGAQHRGVLFNAGRYYWAAESLPRIALVTVGGLLVLAAWTFLNRGLANLFRALTRGLLGPTAGSLRVATLRAQRAAAVEDADSRLRRIERDLHDGTQARLVAVAMQLGEAREHLASGGDPALAADLLDTAHTSTKEALTELREIARGIHPPALDAGLAVALETLAARTPLPVTIDVDPRVEAGGPLAPAVQSLAYRAVAELLTNTAKHAGATRAHVLVERFVSDGGAPLVRLRVRDDGRGGAAVVPGGRGGQGREQTGLAGLVERVAQVDGTFALTSPVGGPTVVDITLPATAA